MQTLFSGSTVHFSRFNQSVGALACALIMSACGGGGGGGTPIGGGQPQGVTLTGTVATGAPVAGAKLTIIDGTGISEACASLTSASGDYSCQLTKAKTAPFLIQAAVGSTTLHAVVPIASDQRINITPISEVMAQKFASSANLSAAEIISRPDEVKSIQNPQQVAATAVDVVKAVVAQVIKSAAGDAVAAIDPLSGVLKAGDKSDKLDQVLATLKFEGTAQDFKVTVPAANGEVVTISVAYSKPKVEAVAQAAGAQIGTIDMTKGQTYEDAIKTLVATINTGTAADIASLAGFQLDRGETPLEWASRFVEEDRDNIGTLTVKAIQRIAVDPITGAWVSRVQLASSKGGVLELLLALKEMEGQWKMVGDELPLDYSIDLRHELNLRNDWESPNSFKFYFTRFFNTWSQPLPGTRSVSDLPDQLEIHILDLTEKFDPAAEPALIAYRAPLVAGCDQFYSLKKGECGYDAGNSELLENTELFAKMANGLTKYVIRAVKNGQCVNCDAAGVPRSVSPAQRAVSFRRIFGTEVTAKQLADGVTQNQISVAVETNVRRYFAMPTREQTTAILGGLLQQAPKSLTLAWQMPTMLTDQVIEGVWGGISSCGFGDWWELPRRQELISNKVSSVSWSEAEIGSRLSTSGYASFTLEANVMDAKFLFRTDVSRGHHCKAAGSAKPMTAMRRI